MSRADWLLVLMPVMWIAGMVVGTVLGIRILERRR